MTHTVELVEHHVIDADVEYAPLDQIKAFVDDAHADARAWLDEQGMDVPVVPHGKDDRHGNPVRMGVSFDVVVGHGTDPSTATEKWTWSARWLHWAAWFRSMASHA